MVLKWYRLDMAMNLRLSGDEQDVLDRLARESGMSKNDVVRQALMEKAAREGHRAQVDRSLDWALDRYGDVVRRLGEA